MQRSEAEGTFKGKRQRRGQAEETSFEQAQTAAGQASCCARRQKAQTQHGNGVEMRQDEARIALAKDREKEGRSRETLRRRRLHTADL